MTLVKTPYVAESGHWYDDKGNPAYTIIGASGQERPTTLRDARKLGLVPSVTTILKESAKPALTNWMIDQAILASLTLPKIENEPESQYLLRIKADAKEQAIKAAEKGTDIHKWIQQGFECRTLSAEGWKYFDVALKTVVETCGHHKWDCEKSFTRDRVGGKLDLSCPEYIIDFKTKETEDKFVTYDEHDQQLAAYRAGLGYDKARCGILFVSYDFKAKLILIEEKKLERGLKMFSKLLDYWYAKTGL